MDDVYYSSGQFARELGITQSKARSLCEAKVIDATYSPGGQWRIVRSELERLKRDGIPSLPRPLPETNRIAAVRYRRTETPLLAEPSEVLIGSAEEVVRLENEVKAIALQRQKEEGLDWFREREEREALRRAEAENAKREQRASVEADQQRQRWEVKWIEYALNSVPKDTPQSHKIETHRAVQDVLQRLSPIQLESTIRQLVDAALDRALAPWNKLKQVGSATKTACEASDVPREMKGGLAWKARMQEAAALRITGLREGATVEEMETAARQSISVLVREFEYGRTCTQLVERAWMKLSGGNRKEYEQGKKAVQEALAKLPIGASSQELEDARTAALEPIRATISHREDQEMREGALQYVELRFIRWPDSLQKEALTAIQEALKKLPAGTPRFELERTRDQVIERFRSLYEQSEQKIRLIDAGLRQIRPLLDKLATDWEFDASTAAIASELQQPIGAVLQEELDGRETEAAVAALVRRLVREELDIP